MTKSIEDVRLLIDLLNKLLTEAQDLTKLIGQKIDNQPPTEEAPPPTLGVKVTDGINIKDKVG